jgi:hypothetical protein
MDVLELRKSLSDADISAVLEDPEVSKLVAHLVDYQNPIRQNLPRKQGAGTAWLLNRRTPATTAAGFVGDTDSISELTSTYARATFNYKTIATQGKITRLAQKIGATFSNILQEEINARVMDFKHYEEWAYINADSTTATQFDGLDKQLDVKSAGGVGAQVVAQTTAAGGEALTLAKLDEAIDTCSGNPNMIICSKKSKRKLQSLLQAQQRFTNVVEVKGGFKLLAYGDIPVFTSTHISDSKWFDGTGVTGETGSTSIIYIIDNTETFVGELTPLTVVPLAKVSSQYDEFDMFCDETLVIGNTKANAALVGFTNA